MVSYVNQSSFFLFFFFFLLFFFFFIFIWCFFCRTIWFVRDCISSVTSANVVHSFWHLWHPLYTWEFHQTNYLNCSNGVAFSDSDRIVEVGYCGWIIADKYSKNNKNKSHLHRKCTEKYCYINIYMVCRMMVVIVVLCYCCLFVRLFVCMFFLFYFAQ